MSALAVPGGYGGGGNGNGKYNKQTLISSECLNSTRQICKCSFIASKCDLKSNCSIPLQVMDMEADITVRAL